MSRDPICGMQVYETNKHVSTYKGKSYYFCCAACKKAFEITPEKYLGKVTQSQPSKRSGCY